jgi:hypothetical protein
MNPTTKLLAVIAACMVLGFSGATAAVVLLSPGDAGAQDAETRAPDGPAEVSTKTADGGGQALGLATYRSKQGRRCLAEGRVADGQLVAADRRGRLVPKPVEETSLCLLPKAPVGLSMSDDHEDPSSVVVSGLVPAGTARVEVRTPAGVAGADPDAAGAFMVRVAAPDGPGQVVVRVEAADGTVSSHKLERRPVPDLADVRRRAAEGGAHSHR